MIGKLGKLPKTHDPRDITVGAVKARSASLGIELPKRPKYFGHGTIFHDGNDPSQWGMNGNGPDDTVQPGFRGAGNCVIACKAHTVRAAARAIGKTITITGKESISDYSAVTGYVIGDDSTDNGTEMREAHKYHQKTGILDAAGNRHKIAAYVAIEDPSSVDELLEAAYVFSGIEIGFNFQAAQYDQFNTPANVTPIWDYDSSSQIEGGHAIPVEGHAKAGNGGVSWERHLWLTDEFVANLVDEAWALIYVDEFRNGKNERGFDLDGLKQLLAKV